MWAIQNVVQRGDPVGGTRSDLGRDLCTYHGLEQLSLLVCVHNQARAAGCPRSAAWVHHGLGQQLRRHERSGCGCYPAASTLLPDLPEMVCSGHPRRIEQINCSPS